MVRFLSPSAISNYHEVAAVKSQENSASRFRNTAVEPEELRSRLFFEFADGSPAGVRYLIKRSRSFLPTAGAAPLR